jgi:L-asparagine transporter-like permease
MATRRRKVRAKETKACKITPIQLKLIKQKDEIVSKMIKRTFYTFLDIIILLSFSLSIYFTYIQDYTRTILFLATGSLLLILMIFGRIIKDNKEKRK